MLISETQFVFSCGFFYQLVLTFACDQSLIKKQAIVG